MHYDVISKYFIKENHKSFDLPLELLDNDTSFIIYNSNSNNIEFSNIYNESNNISLRIFFELDDNNCIHFYIKDTHDNNIYLDVKKTIYKNIYTLLSKYKEFLNIVNSDKYLNKVHLFDIYKNGELIKYEKLTDKEEAELYKIFFNDDCSSKINIEGYENVYDFYLMHNESQWYSLFISKLTENIYNKNLLNIPNKVIEYYDITKEYVIKNINDIIINKVLSENLLTEDDINCEYYSNGLIINIYRRHKNTLLYSIKDDVNYHKETVEEYDKYTFSMNNTLYYIHGKKNEETGNIEYFVDYNNEKVDIESETYEYDENDLIYDEKRYTYIGKLYNEETGEYSYYDYIPGLKHEKYYYTYLSNVKIYPSGATSNNIDTKWYYEINGSTYEYSGDIDLNNILDDNTIYVELVEPIKVYLNIIPGSKHEAAYYEIKDKYEFKFVKSDDKFLINRMQYESCNGNNHFNNNDIIVTTLSAKMNKTIEDKFIEFKTEFKLDNGTKWDFIPMSLKTSKRASVGSTTELAIMSIGDSNIKYERGYYNIICNYSLDGNIDHIYKKIARILVK